MTHQHSTRLANAARAVINRWDSPSWSSQDGGTTGLVYRMRLALEDYETNAHELDDVDRELLEKVRLAVALADNGDPARNVIDEDEMIAAMRLLLHVLGRKPADLDY